MVEQSIVDSVKKYLKALSDAGIDARIGVVFGSCVSGTADQWSDIDLIVVAPEFDGMVSREQVNCLWHVAAGTDSRIEPIPCGQRQWQDDTSSAIIEIARIQGQAISAA